MNDLIDILDELGLSIYTPQLIEEGFDTWDTLCHIRESDLSDLGVKLGHRRKLQKAIADFLQHDKRTTEHSLASDQSQANLAKSIEAGASGTSPTSILTNAWSADRPKRKYKRHPRPDLNAPERPPSAYVLFSNFMRHELREQRLSFTEMAKLVGERWQLLPNDVKERYERRASAGKEKFQVQMAEYQRTEEFANYQRYLAEFKVKNEGEKHRGKRPKVASETSTETQSSRELLDSACGQSSTTIPHTKSLYRLDGFDADYRQSTLHPPAAPHLSRLHPSAAGSPNFAEGMRILDYDPNANLPKFHDKRESIDVTRSASITSFNSTSPTDSRNSIQKSNLLAGSSTDGSKFPVVLPSISKDLPSYHPWRPFEAPGAESQTVAPGQNRQQHTLPNLPVLDSRNDPRSVHSDLGPRTQDHDAHIGASSLAALLKAGELARESDKASDAASRGLR